MLQRRKGKSDVRRESRPGAGQAAKNGFEVVALLRSRPPRTAMSAGLLQRLLTSGQAEDVFPPERSVASSRNESPPEPLPRIVTVDAGDEATARELLEGLSEDPQVETVYVAPPRKLYASARRTTHVKNTGTGPIDQWGLEAIQWHLAPRPDASDIVVGVVDSGIDDQHPDLRAAVQDYADETAEGPNDDTGHGSHVSGIIAARGVPWAGIVGVSNARIRAVKGLGRVYKARNYYRALQSALSGSRVVNLSLGGPEDPTETLLIERAIRRSVVVVAAAGNESEYGNPDTYPGMIPGVIAVGAVDRSLSRAPFSNTGSHIRLCAPGVAIWSTSPLRKSTLMKTTTHALCDGTSMAAPFVTAAISLMLARNPQLRPGEVNRHLRTRPCRGQAARSDEFGEGLLDLASTLAAVPRP